MKFVIVTDAWHPQINGVVRTIEATHKELIAMGYEVELVTPQGFTTIACPTYPEIRLSLWSGRAVAKKLDQCQADALHIATEGPLGIAARRWAMREGKPFTTAYHTRFPEYVRTRFGIPIALSYRFLRWFHNPAQYMLVPTQEIHNVLERRGFGNLKLWSRGVDTNLFYPRYPKFENTHHVIYVFVGRVSIEKNIPAFLNLPLKGEKWVVGAGPQLAQLKKDYPDVVFMGALSADALARVYSIADVCVFPSRTDTFGLVMLEAMACGTPVAAYPVSGPIDVVGNSAAGVLDDDLQSACERALKCSTQAAVAHAQAFSWRSCTVAFVQAHEQMMRRATSQVTNPLRAHAIELESAPSSFSVGNYSQSI